MTADRLARRVRELAEHLEGMAGLGSRATRVSVSGITFSRTCRIETVARALLKRDTTCATGRYWSPRGRKDSGPGSSLGKAIEVPFLSSRTDCKR